MMHRRKYAKEITRQLHAYRVTVLEWECELVGAVKPGPAPVNLSASERSVFIEHGTIPKHVLHPSTFDIGYG